MQVIQDVNFGLGLIPTMLGQQQLMTAIWRQQMQQIQKDLGQELWAEQEDVNSDLGFQVKVFVTFCLFLIKINNLL